MLRSFAKSALLWAGVHFLVVLAAGGLIFVASRIPPRAVNLDPVIFVLVEVEDILLAPRKLLLRTWPGEATPRGLGTAASVVNSLAWGVAGAGLLRWARPGG